MGTKEDFSLTDHDSLKNSQGMSKIVKIHHLRLTKCRCHELSENIFSEFGCMTSFLQTLMSSLLSESPMIQRQFVDLGNKLKAHKQHSVAESGGLLQMTGLHRKVQLGLKSLPATLTYVQIDITSSEELLLGAMDRSRQYYEQLFYFIPQG